MEIGDNVGAAHCVGPKLPVRLTVMIVHAKKSDLIHETSFLPCNWIFPSMILFPNPEFLLHRIRLYLLLSDCSGAETVAGASEGEDGGKTSVSAV